MQIHAAYEFLHHAASNGCLPTLCLNAHNVEPELIFVDETIYSTITRPRCYEATASYSSIAHCLQKPKHHFLKIIGRAFLQLVEQFGSQLRDKLAIGQLDRLFRSNRRFVFVGLRVRLGSIWLGLTEIAK